MQRLNILRESVALTTPSVFKMKNSSKYRIENIPTNVSCSGLNNQNEQKEETKPLPLLLLCCWCRPAGQNKWSVP
jgi:hypothetical protein